MPSPANTQRAASSPTPIEPYAYAVRPKVAARLAGHGLTKLYELLNSGELESFLDGSTRLVVVASITNRQRRLAAAQSTPRSSPSSRFARARLRAARSHNKEK
jgi:hypothetical protein